MKKILDKSAYREYLLEYLTPEQRAKYSKIKMTDKARKGTDHFFGDGLDRKVEEVPGLQPDKSEIHKKVEAHIGKELSHEEYNQGRTADKYGRQAKLSKFISDQNLQKEFAADKSRQGAKVVSKPTMSVVRGVEVAGQTNDVPDEKHPTGHSWAQMSCKNISTGGNNHYLDREIKHGTVVVFGHDNDGKEIYRATLQPHHAKGSSSVAYSLDSEYGVKHPAFTAHAHDVAKRLGMGSKPTAKIYTKHSSVYNDNGETNILHPDLSHKQLSAMIQNGKHFKPGGLFGSGAAATNAAIAAVAHPNATEDHIWSAINSRSYQAKYSALNNPNANADHISAILNDKYDGNDGMLVKRALNHRNTLSHHISQALDSKEDHVRTIAARSLKATPEHLDKALNDKDDSVRESAAMNPNASSENLLKAMKDKQYDVVFHALDNEKKITPEHIKLAMGNKEHYIRLKALRNKNATPEIISKAANDKNENVRHFVASHPYASKEALTALTKDKSQNVRRAVFRNPNASAENISTALDDKESSVRLAATQHPNLNSEHLTKILKNKKEFASIAYDAIFNSSAFGPEHFDLAMNHPKHAVTESMFLKADKNLPTHYIDKGLEHEEINVRLAAIKHPNTTPEQIDGVINGQQHHPWVYRAAASHPNATSENLHNAIQKSGGSPANIISALENPNVKREHFDAALNLAKQNKDRELSSRINHRLKYSDLSESGIKIYRQKLLEYLTPNQRKRYSKHSMHPEARKNTDHFFGAGNDEVHLEIPNYTPDKSEIHTKLEKHIGKELSHEDYNQGMASDKYGRRVRLSKLIKDPQLQKEFAADNSRAGSKTSAIKARVVRGIEVAGQTNPSPDEKHPQGHSWASQSCKNVETGGFKERLESEIHKGSVVYFGTDHDGKEIYRATIHPHYKKDYTDDVPSTGVAYSVDSEYGVKHPAFRAHAEEVARQLSSEPGKAENIYYKHKSVYNDSGVTQMLNPKLTDEHLEKVAKTLKPPAELDNHNKPIDLMASANKEEHRDRLMGLIASHSSLGPKTMDVMLKNSPNIETHQKLMGSKFYPESEKNKIVDGNDIKQKEDLVYHNSNLSKEHLDKLVGLNEPRIFGALVSSHNRNRLTNDHINKMLTHHNSYVVDDAVSYMERLTSEQLHKALDSHPDSRRVAERVMEHPNHDESHVERLINSPNEHMNMAPFMVRKRFESNSKITSKHIDHLLDRPGISEEAATHAATHPKTSEKTLTRIFTGKHPAMQNPNNIAITAIHQSRYGNMSENSFNHAIDFATRTRADHDYQVLESLAHNKNATPEQLDKIAEHANKTDQETQKNTHEAVFLNKNTSTHTLMKHIGNYFGSHSVDVPSDFLRTVMRVQKDKLEPHHIEHILNNENIPSYQKNHAIISTDSRNVIDAALAHPTLKSIAVTNKLVSAEELHKYTKDPDALVRGSVISNPNHDSSHLEHLIKDKSLEVRYQAATSNNLSHSNLKHIARYESSALTHKTALGRNLKDVDHEIVDAALDNPEMTNRVNSLGFQNLKVSSDNIHKALKDPSEYVRMAAIEHPNATEEHFQKAMNDPSKGVRHRASERTKQLGISKQREGSLNENIKHLADIAKGKTTTKLQHGYLRFKSGSVRVSPAEAQAIHSLHKRLNKENRAAAEKMLNSRAKFRKLLKFAQDPKIAKSINK
jgi:HEAT repeat protein